MMYFACERKSVWNKYDEKLFNKKNAINVTRSKKGEFYVDVTKNTSNVYKVAVEAIVPKIFEDQREESIWILF